MKKKVLIIDNVLFFNESSEASISDYLKMPVRLISSDDLFSNLEKATNELIESNKEGNGYSFLVYNPREYVSIRDQNDKLGITYLLDFLKNVAVPNGVEKNIPYTYFMDNVFFENWGVASNNSPNAIIKQNDFLNNFKKYINEQHKP
jgi:hypothetical protein